MPAWFKFYPSDYLLDPDVDALPLEAQGILVRLWCVCARDGFIPDQLPTMCRRGGIDLKPLKKHWESLSKFFVIVPEGLTSPRLNKELGAYEAKCQMLRQSASKGGKVRQANAHANASCESKQMLEQMLEQPAKQPSKQNPAESESESESERTTPPTPSRGQGPAPASPSPRGSRGRNGLVLEYPPAVVSVARDLRALYPRHWDHGEPRPQGEVPGTTGSQAMERIALALAEIEKSRPSVPAADLLLEMVRIYLEESKVAKRYLVGLGVWLSPKPLDGKANYRTYLARALGRLKAADAPVPQPNPLSSPTGAIPPHESSIPTHPEPIPLVKHG